MGMFDEQTAKVVEKTSQSILDLALHDVEERFSIVKDQFSKLCSRLAPVMGVSNLSPMRPDLVDKNISDNSEIVKRLQDHVYQIQILSDKLMDIIDRLEV